MIRTIFAACAIALAATTVAALLKRDMEKCGGLIRAKRISPEG